MAYSKQTWIDRAVENPMTFTMTTNPDTTITLNPAPGNVTAEGTLITASRMNHIENGIKDNSDNITSVNSIVNTLSTKITTLEGKFVYIDGSITLAASSSSTDEQQTILKINFPSGFNKDNCVCVAFGMKPNDSSKNYSYGIGYSAANRYVTGSFYRHCVLGASDDSSKISLQVWNPSTSQQVYLYRLVLMKIT